SFRPSWLIAKRSSGAWRDLLFAGPCKKQVPQLRSSPALRASFFAQDDKSKTLLISSRPLPLARSSHLQSANACGSKFRRTSDLVAIEWPATGPVPAMPGTCKPVPCETARSAGFVSVEVADLRVRAGGAGSQSFGLR